MVDVCACMSLIKSHHSQAHFKGLFLRFVFQIMIQIMNLNKNHNDMASHGKEFFCSHMTNIGKY